MFYSNTIILLFNVTIYLFWLTRKKIRISHHDRLQVTPVCQDSHKRLQIKRKTYKEKKKEKKKEIYRYEKGGQGASQYLCSVATIKVKAFLRPDARVRPRPRSLSRSEKEKPKLSIFFFKKRLIRLVISRFLRFTQARSTFMEWKSH